MQIKPEDFEVVIDVDVSQLDVALEKVQRLNELLKESNELAAAMFLKMDEAIKEYYGEDGV